MIPLDAAQQMTYVANGGWTCKQNKLFNIAGYDQFGCIRLLPSDSHSSTQDTRFEIGAMEAYPFKSTDFIIAGAQSAMVTQKAYFTEKFNFVIQSASYLSPAIAIAYLSLI